ncbi:hypothetical protein [Agromyces marinus]|uniref:Uncharacterized protein n=1 Tax=Agromyces marinus TaxID=1389020 RepID=A0ABM8H590_9MICO|nr:hypothetical protein [Agromyces marinus]UIP59110.1 hypothetical protein DSM26151_20050 [Agromyces marinus]BDZ55900.1 hypothetical protein GCM10025870_29730 [Agromyces marinus]
MTREHDDHDPQDPQDPQGQQEPLERLRAADPAAGVEARDGFADEVVAATTGGAGVAPVDLGAERVRRRRAATIAAAAAAVLLVGAAGYGLGAAAVGGPTQVAAPPISLQDASGASGEIAVEEGPTAGSGRMAESGAADLSMPFGGGRNHFTATGLSTDAGSAQAYAYDARSASTAESVAALAAALGMAGDPVLADGSWTVGPQDGSAPSLSVSLDGALGFWYNDPAKDPWVCVEGGECEPSGGVPGEQAAIDALRGILSDSGRDPEAYEYTSETWEGSPTRAAQAWPVVDGQRLDQPWTLELTEDGVYSAYGTLAELVPLGEYAIVSEQEAFERLSDPRFGVQGVVMPFMAEEGDAGVSTEWVPPTEPPPAPEPGTDVSWPVVEVELVGARLGLATHWQPDGGVLVVPTYEFTDAAGGTWSVIAVAESQLDLDA